MHSPSGRTIRDPGGFTFVEIITALVLLALFSAMAVPSMSGYVDQVRTRGALDHLVADIGFARLLAVQQGRRVRVAVNANSTYSVDTMSIAGSWGPLKSVNIDLDYKGVAFTGSTTLEFSSRGLLSNQASDGYVKVMRNDARDSLFVSPAGRVYRAF